MTGAGAGDARPGRSLPAEVVQADDPEGAGRVSPLSLDSFSMWEASAALPEQFAAAVTLSDAVTEAVDAMARGASRRGSGDARGGSGGNGRSGSVLPFTEVVVLGMGESGTAGDVLAALVASHGRVPVQVVRSAVLPGGVGPDTLVFAVSWSGSTRETVAGAAAAREAGATVIAVTAGGRLAAGADDAGDPVIVVPSSIPQSRAALGAITVPMLVVAERLGLLAGIGPAITAAAEQLARRRDHLVASQSPAEVIARRIGRTMPLIHGSAGLTGVAAQRWKNQVNTNAKVPSFFAVLPDLCHNEVSGWGQQGDVTRQVFTLVTLRHADEQAGIASQFAAVAAMLDEVMADIIEVQAEGDGALACFFDHVLVGDFVSLHLAGREDIDPGPIPAVTDIKTALAGSG